MTATALRPPKAPLGNTPRWYADLGGVAAAISLLIVVALWVGNRGLQQIAGGGAEAMSAAGRLTGLIASDLLLLQVLLMARIPVVERAFGQDRLARWHRWTGFTSFWLMIVHIVTITLGYAASAHATAFAELWDMIWTYPGMLLATAGTLLLILVVVTSVRAARRRLRYESWHLLHLYAYLGVGLALPHQLWTGADFTASAAARLYWWTLYGVSAGAVLAYRIGLPAWRNHRHRLVVTRVVPEGPGLTSVYLSGRDLSGLPARAGQFFTWRFLDGPGWTRANPYSLSATPGGDQLRITVKNLGDSSSRVANLRPGTKVLVEGPYGKLTGETYTGGPVVLVACGIGVTPLLSLLGELPYRPGEATLIYRARSEAELAFRGELEWFAAHRGVRVVTLLGPRAGHPSWLPADVAAHGDVQALRQIAPQIAGSQVYVCGPEAWTAQVHAAARASGVAADRLHTELFSW
ncbi:oxidoreductase [Actinoplanes sp. SE50]|uniref:ferredoxin reductase family protein n=1 Tax=unclassified Actinoplanes TaxID=2626549 RepID=UPI00023ED0CC|nr:MULTISPECIES: ferredoxin reductase family protein [unclassified Actinoplanes]AEV86082.1 Respiratory burst oxidase-like protein [Actinoplanes sp. SE50/110]ATO84480.1 oxidoreductase [Actinoplanes sp. SE50]SLM01890.1 oxidoreductase [Actinoplanes sp. SE50/110]